MRQVRQLGRLGLVGRVETPSPNGLAMGCGFCHNGLNRRNRLNVAGQARPAVLGEVPCV